MAAGAGSRSPPHHAPLPRRHADPGDAIRDRRGRGEGDRLHAAAQQPCRCRAHGRGRERPRRACTCISPFASATVARIPWIDRQEDDTLRIVAGADQMVLRSATPVSVADNCIESDFVVAAGETVAFTLTYAASHLAPPDPIDPQEAFAATEAVLGRLGGQGERSPPGERHHAVYALAHHAEGADLRADRRHRRGADHQPARDAGRHSQLGLSFLLAARRDAVAARPDERRLLRGGGGMARLAAACRRRPAAQAQIMYSITGENRADRMGGRLAAGLRGLAAGAHRQRCARAAPARRLRRGDGRAAIRRAAAASPAARPPGT